jgi:hypothetical protein
VAVKNQLTDNLFPDRIKDLLHAVSRAGFFERSVVIGSWVMLIYQELYGARYVLRTLDVDFAVHVAHIKSKLRADLKQLITGLGFADYLAAEGVQKFTGGGYEVEFIGQRSGGRDKAFLSIPEWNVTAIPLPFINILTDFSDVAELSGYTIRFPIPEAFFLHKLIIAQKRLSDTKRDKDLEQCAVIMTVVNDESLRQVTQARRFSRETRRHIATSCESIGFPLHRIEYRNS